MASTTPSRQCRRSRRCVVVSSSDEADCGEAAVAPVSPATRPLPSPPPSSGRQRLRRRCHSPDDSEGHDSEEQRPRLRRRMENRSVANMRDTIRQARRRLKMDRHSQLDSIGGDPNPHSGDEETSDSIYEEERAVTSAGEASEPEPPIEDFIVDDVDESNGEALGDCDPRDYHRRSRPISPCLPMRSLVNMDDEEAFDLFYKFVLKCCVAPTYAQVMPRDDCGSPTLIALQKISERITSRKQNWVKSGAWSTEFIEVLCVYPHLRVMHADCSFNSGECQACNRGGRPATSTIVLSGPQYDSKLRPTDCGSNRMASASNSTSSSRSFGVGRFCLSRIRLFHALQHYIAHLFVIVKDRFSRVCRSQGSLKRTTDYMLGLKNDFYCGFEELQRHSQEYASTFGGSSRRYIELEFSSEFKQMLPSCDLLERIMPIFFGCRSDNHESTAAIAAYSSNDDDSESAHQSDLPESPQQLLVSVLSQLTVEEQMRQLHEFGKLLSSDQLAVLLQSVSKDILRQALELV